jgi:glycerophosphoryl diester phosphodiesterase
MLAPVSIIRNGHVTWLKWHRARRRDIDTVFTGARILEGMRLGASVEVDLVIHGDRGFAVLHDLSLGRESTGGGVVAETSAAELRLLRLRSNDGAPTDHPIMLLEDLTALLATGELHPAAVLQLDFKEDAAALDSRTIANFAKSVAPVARHMILSSGDAAAVTMLSDAAPYLRIGYDPCHRDAVERLIATRDFAGFAAEAVAASPRAEMIYLAQEVVLGAADAGFDIVAAFHRQDRKVDAYTIKEASAATLPLVERLLALQVDQITTDDPEGLAARVG